jgi:starch synthase
MNILFATPECAGLIKTGGLGDVSASLPAALRRLGFDARVLLPAYRNVRTAFASGETVAELEPYAGFPSARIIAGHTPIGTTTWLLDCPEYYDRDSGPYLDAGGLNYSDNAQRFGFLSYAAARIAHGVIPGWRPDVLHCNDWQTALAPAYSRLVLRATTPCVQTIHNLAFQGLFPRPVLETLGIPPSSFTIEGLEFYGQLSFLKAGLVYADALTTVSPTYAREVQQEELGFGLHGLLARRREALTGILNGIDDRVWDPATDSNIEQCYGPQTLERKVVNKVVLRRMLGLEPAPGKALIGVVSRLTQQKGIDLVVEAAPYLLKLPVQLAVLGSGETQIERSLAALVAAHPGQVAVRNGFDERLAHHIEAGADLLLMPSRFEPCGLNQMYSQRYGTPPVVRGTGGLADTVTDYTLEALERDEATGFVFQEASATALLAALERALKVYRDRPRWHRLQRNGMRRDFGWAASARRYAEIYERLRRARG